MEMELWTRVRHNGHFFKSLQHLTQQHLCRHGKITSSFQPV
jgi:hypothetical protein